MSRTFFRKFLPAVPRAAGRLRLPGFGPSRRRVRYYTRPRRGAGGKPARTQDADNSSAVERMAVRAGGRHRPGVSPQPIDATAPDARRLARLGPPGRSARLRVFNCLYTSRRIGARLQAGDPPAFIMQAAPLLSFAPPYSPSPNLSRSEYQPCRPIPPAIPSRKKNGRLRARPPSARAIPSATVPGRFSLCIYIEMFSSDCRRCA